MKNSDLLQLRDQSLLQDEISKTTSVDKVTLTRGKLLILTGIEPRLPNTKHVTLLVLINTIPIICSMYCLIICLKGLIQYEKFQISHLSFGI
jgi:hypothetical protein